MLEVLNQCDQRGRTALTVGRTVKSRLRKTGRLASERNVVKSLVEGQNWDVPERISCATLQAVEQVVRGSVTYP